MVTLIFLFIATITITYALNTVESNPPIETRIIGGLHAHGHSFPYQVSIRHTAKNLHFCGGSILNSTIILTAANCLIDFQPSDLNVVVGSHKLSSGGDVYTIQQLKLHEQFNKNTRENDIGLIILQTPIQYSDNIRPIKLETRYAGSSIDVVLSGWGRISYPGVAPDNLQHINLKTISNVRCQMAHAKAPNSPSIHETQLCTFTRAGEGACKGDFGGPLVASDKQIGIASWGQPCALGFPDVYTRISSYLDWIATNSQV
ncbi:hypothetical protein ILUMI_24335 [Ignelater luminosus]|uniref:Peptidase S1 domain-containing protein n=1 Tax=Ignelater luminosus TaxID=2038154 RepID=A0A8K0G130_IGNLU|nr:hypothetical protein ILUMI_24335 [Ignelater luminosus]